MIELDAFRCSRPVAPTCGAAGASAAILGGYCPRVVEREEIAILHAQGVGVSEIPRLSTAAAAVRSSTRTAADRPIRMPAPAALVSIRNTCVS